MYMVNVSHTHDFLYHVATHNVFYEGKKCNMWHINTCLPDYIILAKLHQYISAIFTHESHYAIVLHSVLGNPHCYFVSNWLIQILCSAVCSPPATVQVVHKIQTVAQSSYKPLYNVTFTRRFLHGRQMTGPVNKPGYMLWWWTVLMTQICREIDIVQFYIAVKWWFLLVMCRTLLFTHLWDLSI